ncbi:MAG: T9SS type A sorting domain-containing protein [Janthinobacterium lividum]
MTSSFPGKWPALVVISTLTLLNKAAVQAQIPGWQLAVTSTQNAASGNISQVLASATDASGNVFLVGAFQGSISFGSTTLTTAGSSDGFVAKWSPVSNSFLWAQQVGGTGYDVANALAVSGSTIYVAGSYSSTAVAFGGLSLSNAGTSDIFVAKLTDAGSSASFGWAQRAGGADAEAPTGLAASGASVYMSGYYYSATAAFGTTNLPNAGGSDAFLAKLTDAGSSGSFVWAQGIGGTSYERANTVAVSGSSIYLAGYFGSTTVSLGTTTLQNATATAANDVFVAKLLDAGSTSSFAWAQRAGGPGDDIANTIAVAGNGVYVAGIFSGATASFGSTTLTNSASGTSDIFVTKLTDAGSTAPPAWAQRAGGIYNDVANAVAINTNKVYVAGSFSSPAISLGPTTLTNGSNAKSHDALVFGLTDAGSSSSIDWGLRAGGGGNDFAYSLALNGANVYVAGSIVPVASFGNLSIANPVGYDTSYLASFLDNTALATSIPAFSGSISLSPNPAHARTTMVLPASYSNAPIAITLTDIVGRVVRPRTDLLPAAGLTHDISLAGLTKGLYILHIQAGATTATRRLAVE